MRASPATSPYTAVINLILFPCTFALITKSHLTNPSWDLNCSSSISTRTRRTKSKLSASLSKSVNLGTTGRRHREMKWMLGQAKDS